MINRKVASLEEWKAGRSLEALATTPRAREWIARSHQAQVMHVFERACNLVNEWDEIVSLVSRRSEWGPFAIVVPEEAAPFSKWVRVGIQVRVRAEELLIGEQRVSLRIAESWDPRPPWHRLRTSLNTILEKLPELNTLLQVHAPAGSFAGLVSSTTELGLASGGMSESGFAARFLKTARAPAAFVRQGIVADDLKLVQKGARRLAGLGGGLTPAGDDCLMGAIYAAWLIWPQARAEKLSSVISQRAAPRTNRISAAWLSAAADGDAGMHWHNSFDALLSSDRSGLEKAISDMLSVGHTSGADALSGFVAVLNLYAGTRKPRK